MRTRPCSVVPAVYVSPGTAPSPPGQASTPPASRESTSDPWKAEPTLTATRYWLPADTRRPVTYAYVPPPVGTEPSENDVRTSAEVCATELRYEPVLVPGPAVSVAVPGVTDWRVAPELTVHGPPTSA